MLNVPFDRIQSVDFKRNIVHQFLNVVSVQVDTAGSKGSELELDAIEQEKRIRKALWLPAGSVLGFGFAAGAGLLNMAIMPPIILTAHDLMPRGAALGSGIVMGLAWATGSVGMLGGFSLPHLLQMQAEAATGIDWEYLAAINLVEFEGNDLTAIEERMVSLVAACERRQVEALSLDDRDDAGEDSRSDDRHQQERPDQRVDRARGDDDQERDRAHQDDARRRVAGGEERDRAVDVARSGNPACHSRRAARDEAR